MDCKLLGLTTTSQKWPSVSQSRTLKVVCQLRKDVGDVRIRARRGER